MFEYRGRSRGRGRGRGRGSISIGRGRGRGGFRGTGRGRPPPSKEQLDREIEEYMSSRKDVLDKDLDDIHSRNEESWD